MVDSIRSHSPGQGGLPIGWDVPSGASCGFGFHRPAPACTPRLLSHEGEQHLLTIAPTGAGKGRSGVIPALLHHPGQVVTIDIKGENYHVTARRRREMGHAVVTLDPFSLLESNSDALNPLDLLTLPQTLPECDLEMLSELVTGGVPMSSKDLFWEYTGRGLITGLIGLAAENEDPHQRHLPRALDHLLADDTDYHLAVQLDTRKFKSRLTYQEIAAYLSHESERCRPSVRSTAQAFVKCLNSGPVRQALGRTSFDLTALMSGEPIDIFIIFPPDKLESHKALLRLWIGTLLNVLLRRRCPPEAPTLLLLDEAAQLGHLPQLKTTMTLGRGYGVQVWTFWQDLAQLRQNYPQDWETILNNAGVVQMFGLNNGWVARGCAGLTDMPLKQLIQLRSDEQVLVLPGVEPRVARRIDYLTDELFAGRFDPNPRYRRRPVGR